jgi:cation diffusion facilitator family transporter
MRRPERRCPVNDRLRRGLKVTFLGLAANSALAGAKLAAGIFGHSHALIADAVESFADVGSSIIVWRGLVVAAAPPDADHPYGHGKAEPIAGLIVAGMLLAAAFQIALQSFREILNPTRPPEKFTLMVLLAVVVVKEFLFRVAHFEGTSTENTAVKTDAWHHRGDAITSLAAMVGISIAIWGGPKYAAADGIAAIAAALFIAWNGLRLGRSAVTELMDTAPGQDFSSRVARTASAIEGVAAVEKCLVRKVGYRYFVDMHIEVDPEMSVRRAHEIAHQVKDVVRADFPAVSDVLVHVEPRE